MPLPATEYHARTKHTPKEVRQSDFQLDYENKPTPYKVYTDLPTVSFSERRDTDEAALDAVSETGPSFADAGIGSTGPDVPTVDRETLAALCYDAAGITKRVRRHGEEFAFRAAACTGALYHVDLYPVVGDVAGLDAGVYHYDPRTDSLDVLREGDYRGVVAEASGDPAVETAPVTFAATSTWWRNAWKYRERTYRHAFWDSGTVLANLLASAHAADLPARVVAGFADDTVVDLLGLDPRTEAPLELVPVGVGEDATDAPTSRVDAIDPETEPLSSNPKEYPLIQEAWEASTLSGGEEAVEWRVAGPRPVDGRDPGGGTHVALDPVDRETASARPLRRTVERRGSCREYKREELSFRKVSTVLDRAVRGPPMDVRVADGPPLQFVDCYCIVNGVDGVEAGAYQYFPARRELERLRAGEFRREAGHLALDQRLAADAALNVYFLADLDAITATLGDRGYRAAQLEAALTAGRLYLATYAHRDLGGTGLTFYDDEVTEFFEPQAEGRTPMFLYTLGRPA